MPESQFDKSVKQLLDMRRKVDDAKAKVQRLEGQVDSARSRMKQEFGVDNLDAAQKLLGEMDGKLSEMEKRFNEGVTQLSGAYDWWGNGK